MGANHGYEITFPELIISKLRETEILLNQGIILTVVWKKAGLVTAPTIAYVKSTVA